MSGIPNSNRQEFHRVEKELRERGHVVFSPSRTTEALYPPSGTAVTKDKDYLKHVLLVDLASVMACDVMFTLSGWSNSKGARMEVAVARFLGITITHDLNTFKRSKICPTLGIPIEQVDPKEYER